MFYLNDTFSDSDVYIEGFSLIRNDRDGAFGGIAFYVKDSLQASLCDKLSHNTTESLWLIIKSMQTNILIGSIYHPPNSCRKYFDDMIINIEQAMSLNMKTVILGDFNLNAFTSKDINDIEQLLQLTQLVQEATSSTLKDLIFTNMPDKHTATGVVHLSISDHYLTYTSVSFKCPKAPPSIIGCRNLIV